MKGGLYILLLLIAIFVGTLTWIYLNTNPNPSPLTTVQEPTSEKTSADPTTKYPLEFTASFEIYTNGTKRIFTNPMYHNLSPSLYIQSQSPSTIYVIGQPATWQNFFDTLPMSLSKDCLVTGTNESFCNTQTHQLRFYLNGVETPNALDLQIQPDDFLRVTYTQ